MRKMACVALNAVYMAQPSTMAKPAIWSVRSSSLRRTCRNLARSGAAVTARGLSAPSPESLAARRGSVRQQTLPGRDVQAAGRGLRGGGAHHVFTVDQDRGRRVLTFVVMERHVELELSQALSQQGSRGIGVRAPRDMLQFDPDHDQSPLLSNGIHSAVAS